MGTQGPGRKRIPNREKLTAEDDALNQIAREAEARLAARRAARAEARDIRMKELEKQQKELFHSHKEDSERYSRHSRRHASVSDDEERMSVGSRGSLRPSARLSEAPRCLSGRPSDYSGFLGSSSRASSRASSARASPVVEERPDRDFLDKGSRTASTLSAATLASLGGASSRRGSCDTSFSVETEASIRDMKDSLAEVEEKYRKAMVSNAQLHNEKSTLMFQVETLREELSDMEELLWEARRHGDDRTKECERERQAHSILQFQFKEMTETLRHTEELLTEVSALRLQNGLYSQEISDLHETLQWKEKKIGALERQREISDIVRIERDRLKDDVVRLRDLLKKHGVVVSPDVGTNGETAQGEAEDDVTAESASRLAEEPSHGGRESMLGKVGEQQTAEGSKLPTNDMMHKHCLIYKRSQSLNVISASDQTRGDSLKQVKGTYKQDKDRKDTTEKHPGRNEGERKQPRNKESIQDPNKKNRQDANLLLRNEGIKKQPVNQKCESKSAVTRSIVGNQAFKGRTRPDSEPGLNPSSVSHQDVPVMEMKRSFNDRNSQTQTDVEGTRLKVKCEAVRRASAEKIHKSRLVPPRPAKDMILDNKVLSLIPAGKRNCLTQEKHKLDIAGVKNETSSSHRDVVQTCSSAVNPSFQNQQADGSCSEREVKSDISTVCAEEKTTNEIIAPTSVNTMNTNEFVEIDGEQCDEVTDFLTDLVKTSLKLQQETITENQADLSYTSISEGPSLAKLKTMTDDLTPPVEKAMSDERSGTPEDPVEEVQIEDTIQHNSSERPERKDQTETSKLSTASAFFSSDSWKDWSGLENMFHSVLQGFMEDGGLPEIPESLHQWLSDLEKGNVSNKPLQCESIDHESARRPMEPELTAEVELPVKDSPEGPKTAAGHIAITKICSVSGMFDDPSLLEHEDVSGSTSKVCEDEEAAENTSSSTCDPEGEVGGSSSKEDELSRSCCHDLVFINSYFAEPVKTRSVSSGSNASTNPKTFVEVVSEPKQQREIVPVVVGQSSKVRRLLEITADEIRAMAVPELAVMSLREGRIVADRWIDESPGLNIEVHEEASVTDMDSCEEVDEVDEEVEEVATQQPAEQQEGRPEEKRLSGRKRFCLHKHKTECKIS